MLALNLVPCSDTVIDNHDDCHIELTQSGDSDHNHSSEDLCSLFCHCHCCHVHIINLDLFVFELIEDDISSKIITRFDNQGTDVHSFLFHPPQV